VVLELIADLSRLVGVAPACDALALPRATYYRRSENTRKRERDP
jgi:hypothetical protein